MDLYTFFDFESARASGGAGQLVSVVKAFAAAGVANKVIAVFDNDTAAREAALALRSVHLPDNFATLHYPDLDKLKSYPTIGPTGTTAFNVNRLAGSIELYLGDDVVDGAGIECPVQWRGVSSALGTYQGEVMNKNVLQAAYRRRVAKCRDNPHEVAATDWSGLAAIWKTIFAAFDRPF